MLHVSISPELLTTIFGIPITNTLFYAWVVIACLALLAFLATRKIKVIPEGAQNVAEIVVDSLVGFLSMIAGSRETARKYFPLVATVFFFVLLSNWMGILPGVGSIGFYEHHGEETVFVPLLRSVNSDLNVTLALALIVVTTVHVIGVSTIGALHHAGKFITFKNPIHFFVGILELVSEFAKIVSFSFRLFGNIFAGEVLLVIISFLVPYLVPIPFLGLELFVGVIQATIFSVLAMMFIASAEKMPDH